jgi:pyridoxal phosphate enzyme (YggS family)
MEAERQEQIRQNYFSTLERIQRACTDSGRPDRAVKLVVVSKTQPVDVVDMAIAAGVEILGENYAEEAVEKMAAVQAIHKIEWHMIGHVQSRKARIVVGNFAMVHSLDSSKLAEKYNALCAERKTRLPALIELNLGGEASKSGWPAWSDGLLQELYASLEKVVALPYLDIRGLMTMPPIGADPEASRPYFKKLRELRDIFAQKFQRCSWNELSMGTSADYEVGVSEGATLVRVGQAILGPRIYEIKTTNN